MRASALLTTLAALAAAGLIQASSSLASADAASCPPIPAPVLRTTFGLPSSAVFHNHVITGDADQYQCAVGVWSGPAPTDAATLLQAGKSGNGALVGLDTWTPNDSSPTVGEWTDTRYDDLTSGFETGLFNLPGVLTGAGWPTHDLLPFDRHGYDAEAVKIAVQGVGQGLTLVIGCWWNDHTSSAVCIYVEEATFKPIATHLNALSNVVVKKILG